jgi:hypothetical protein
MIDTIGLLAGIRTVEDGIAYGCRRILQLHQATELFFSMFAVLYAIHGRDPIVANPGRPPSFSRIESIGISSRMCILLLPKCRHILSIVAGD